MISAIVCDFGGVLTTPMTASFLTWAADVDVSLEDLGKAVELVGERDGEHPLYELECGRLSEPEFMARVGGALSEIIDRPVDMADFSTRLWDGLAVNEPMVALMTELQAAGYRMALLTNNVREWGVFWRALVPVDELFELVVDSAYVGMRKPGREIYELTLERFGMDAASCLFIDDFEINCDGARAVGMHAVQYTEPEPTIAAIRSLLAAEGLGTASGGPLGVRSANSRSSRDPGR